MERGDRHFLENFCFLAVTGPRRAVTDRLFFVGVGSGSLVGRLLTICPSVDRGCNRHFWSSNSLKYQRFFYLLIVVVVVELRLRERLPLCS